MVREQCVPGTFNPEKLETLLQVKNVSQSFKQNNGTTLIVLKDLDLEVPDLKGKPQILTILGPSGGGKSTAARIIAGLDKPKSGEILITNGHEGDLFKLCPVEAGQVGVVFQKYPLFEDMTVLDNLLVGALAKGMEYRDAQIKAVEYMTEFNLMAQKDSWPVQLSGGQRQRVAILQQLMVPNRHFLILDEPFSGLDSQSITAVIKLLITISYTHTLNTFIIITHDVTSALIISDTVYLLGRSSSTSGAKITHTFDLISEGLAYHPNIEDIPRFNEIRKEIKYEIMPKL